MSNHLGGYIEGGDPHTYMPDIWGYLTIKYGLRSVLDVGCGTGQNLKWFRDYRKSPALGIEGDPTAIAKSILPEITIQHDYTVDKYVPRHSFDLGLCTEFAEHVEQQYEDNWFSTLKLCRYVLFSHATPGQDGYHHVNCQETEYWLKRFEQNNFSNIESETKILRNTDKLLRAPWCRSTLLFFKNNENL
jgi:SAM-dependent methyltransferase